jgi:hypothetical protein
MTRDGEIWAAMLKKSRVAIRHQARVRQYGNWPRRPWDDKKKKEELTAT